MFTKLTEFMLFWHKMISTMNLHCQIPILIIKIIVHLLMWSGFSIMHNYRIRFCMCGSPVMFNNLGNLLRDNNISLFISFPVCIASWYNS